MVYCYVLLALVSLYMGLAAVVDFRRHKIPNWLTVPAAVLGLLFHLFAPPPWGLGILLSLAGFALGFVLLIAPRLLGGGGMGDVKMLAALGAWLGPKFILIAFGLGAVLAAFMAIGVMVLSTFSRGVSATQHRYLSGGETLIPRDRKQKRVLPLAVPMALATALVLVWILVKGSL